MIICTRTGRLLSRGERLRVLTDDGFTEGVLDTVTLDGAVRVKADSGTVDVGIDHIEALWRLN